MRNACWGYLCQSGAMELKEVKGRYDAMIWPIKRENTSSLTLAAEM